MPLLEQKCRHLTKLSRMIKTLIFTHLRFIKAVAITPISIKMIKGEHLLTPRPNMLLKQRDENTAEKKKERKADLLNQSGT